MRLLSAVAMLVLLIPSALPSAGLAAESSASAPALSEPSLSPDGREIAFVSGGDIWTVPSAGGEARLLVAHPATESRPLYSPDGSRLAFTSNRTGNGDVYVLDLSTGDLRRLTYDDSDEEVESWSPDGRWLYFRSTGRDISGMNDIYRVAAGGGTPMQVSSERYVNEYFAAPSPDGKSLAFTARGIPSSQWWRHGHSHIDETQIWLLRGDPSAHDYESITQDGAKELWPMWAPNGRTIWYMSDRDGNENLWKLPIGGQPLQVTKFTSGRLLWPSMARDGASIVFERGFGIWKLDTAGGVAASLAIRLRGLPASQSVEHRRVTDHFSDLAISPDGRKMVFAARGDLFAAATTDPGEATRVTDTPALETQATWAPDNHTIAYVSDRDGNDHVFQYDFTSQKETQLSSGPHDDDTPRFSPDGKFLAFQRDQKEIDLLDLATHQSRTLVTALLDRPPFGSERPFDWSPDSKWIAYLGYGSDLFRNAWVVPAAGGEGHQVSFLSNASTDPISWSSDGKYLVFTTGQRTENAQLARVDLVKQTPRFKEDQFRDLFKNEKTPEPAETRPAPPASEPAKSTEAPAPKGAQAGGKEKKPPDVSVDFDGIRRRLTLLPVSLDVNTQVLSPDGKWVAFSATAAGQENIYIYSLDELSAEPAVPRQLTSTAGSKRSLAFSPDSKEIYYSDQGRISAVSIEPMRTRAIAVSAEMDVDFAREKNEAFRQAWTWLRDNFFDAKMNGVDWSAVRDQFAPRVAAARTGDEFRRLLSLMVGELNASHLGAGAPGDQNRTAGGRIGVRFDRDEYERNNRLRVSEVIGLSPADVAGIRTGDVLTAVDGVTIGPVTNFDQLLQYKIGRKVSITLAGVGEAPAKTVSLQPVTVGTEKGLVYKQWVSDNRDYVRRVSQGRLGYVHMIDMSADSLAQLAIDLDAENRARQGVLVDVRNNNGGFVNVYAIDIFARRGYMTMTSRGFPAAPARTLLGQRALEKPTILLTNRHSLSDAEDFTEGYRTLHLGKVVGEPTAGWIIYTSNVPLIDGTSFRIPSTRITDASGADMERHPRPVDLFVQRPIGESYRNRDSQIDAAVKELLAEIGKGN
jgi:tricorn protease